MIQSSYLGPSTFWDSFQSDTCSEFRDIEGDIIIGDVEDFELDSCTDGSGYSTPYDGSSNSSHYDSILDELCCSVSDNFVSELLDSNISGFSDQDWPLFSQTDSSKCQDVNSQTISELVQRNPLQFFQSSKSWSSLSKLEQETTLHALSIVTYQMSIREQMEIIKIIDPLAVISPDCKEFALDCTALNDMKFRKIKDFVKRQTLHFSAAADAFFLAESTKDTNVSDLLSSKTANSLYARTKTKAKKQKEQCAPEDKQLKRKKLKQTRKERKSGLFVYEKKLKIDISPSEDEDVNVLE